MYPLAAAGSLAASEQRLARLAYTKPSPVRTPTLRVARIRRQLHVHGSLLGRHNYSASSSPELNNFSIVGATSSTSVVSSAPTGATYATPITFTATVTGEYGNVKGGKKSNARSRRHHRNGNVELDTGCSASTVSGYPGVAPVPLPERRRSKLGTTRLRQRTRVTQTTAAARVR